MVRSYICNAYISALCLVMLKSRLKTEQSRTFCNSSHKTSFQSPFDMKEHFFKFKVTIILVNVKVLVVTPFVRVC